MTKIKFCGLKNPGDVLMMNKYNPDYVGFVFYEKSHRNVSKIEAKYLSSLLNRNIIPVGVFVNENPENIVSLFKSDTIKVAQLHGNENEDYINFLKKESFKNTNRKLKVIKALEITNNEKISSWQYSNADYLLFDSGKGSGKVFDWSLIKNIKKPFFVAGGLNSNNVNGVIQKLNPYAVDVSSGIETNKIKDEKKVKEFIKNVNHVSK